MTKYFGTALWLALLLSSACGKKEEILSAVRANEPAITQVSDITSKDNRADLVGRRVQIERAAATDVVGDVVFWIGEPNNTIPVVLGSELRHQGKEGDLNIRGGNHYRIAGVVRLVENVDRNDPTWRLVDDSEMDAISTARVYIETSSVVRN